MKKLSILLFLSVLIFTGCSSDDDEKQVIVTSFEGKLTEANSEFESESTEVSNYYFKDTFEDNGKYLKFDHYYSIFNGIRSFAGFTYTNKTDKETPNSPASITGKGKVGSVYLTAYTNSWTPAAITINNPNLYFVKGAWVTNSVYAYNGMTTDNLGGLSTTTFTKGSWFKLTANGYDNNDNKIGNTEIYLANYKSDNDLPLTDWVWFDLTSLKNASKISFELTSTDTDPRPEVGMNTPASFCIDGITLEEK